MGCWPGRGVDEQSGGAGLGGAMFVPPIFG